MTLNKTVITVLSIILLTEVALFSATSVNLMPDDYLSRLIRAVEQKDTTSNRKATLTGVLDQISAGSETSDSLASLRVLQFLTEVCDGASFYESGYWGPEDALNPPKEYSGPLPSFDSEGFCMPVKGVITSKFGYRPVFKRAHSGIDIALETGDTIKAALPGIVSRVGYQTGGYGIFVIITHTGGLETRYAHLECSLVEPGKPVKAGEGIALGGTTGNSTGPHLHFETRYMGSPLDPTIIFPIDQ